MVQEFRENGIEILTVAGYVRAAAEGDDAPVLAELAELVDLAHDLGAQNVRVFPGGGGQDPAVADATAARRLAAAAPHAADQDVRILLETHDSHRAGVDVARVVGTVGHGQIGALWDVMHTWLSGEEPPASHAVLAPHLGYVQVKDIASAENTEPLPLGAGVLPWRPACPRWTRRAGSAGSTKSAGTRTRRNCRACWPRGGSTCCGWARRGGRAARPGCVRRRC